MSSSVQEVNKDLQADDFRSNQLTDMFIMCTVAMTTRPNLTVFPVREAFISFANCWVLGFTTA